MNLRKFADIYGGIPLFIILIIYFSNNINSNIEVVLLLCCVIALMIDVYLSFIYNNPNILDTTPLF